jgi:hypothetical protein
MFAREMEHLMIPPRLALAMFLAIPIPAFAQTAQSEAAIRPRSFTILGGAGNTMGWFGLQGEKHLLRQRASVIGGLGYTPAFDPGDASGVTVAGGVRGYTTGRRHRGFLEVSVSQLVVEESCFVACRRSYGPGVQVGYQLATPGGFTVLASLGVGYAPSAPEGRSKGAGMLGLGLGYTWRP